MADAIYRLTRPGEETELRRIWSAAYDGDTACADVYFNQYYHPGDGVICEAGGRICSAIYLLEGYRLHVADAVRSCTYLYALGTPEEARGKGYGGKTIWRSGVEGYLRGADFVCFIPASESLRQWYQDILGTRSVFYHRCITVSAGAVPTGALSIISCGEYLSRREALLTGHPHIEPPVAALELQQAYCRLWSGNLWQFTIDDQIGIALGDAEDGKLTLRELLFPNGDPRQAARLLMKQLSCTCAEVRTPAFWHEDLGDVKPDCILVPGGTRFPQSREQPFWGFGMD